MVVVVSGQNGETGGGTGGPYGNDGGDGTTSGAYGSVVVVALVVLVLMEHLLVVQEVLVFWFQQYSKIQHLLLHILLQTLELVV